MNKLSLWGIIFIIMTIGLMGAQCPSTPPPPTTPTATPVNNPDTLEAKSIMIASGEERTNDVTPPIAVSASGAAYMAFSGDGVTWTSWLPYSEIYTNFNLNTGPGCTLGDGIKVVYVKFKNAIGLESKVISDTIILDTKKPYLLSVSWTDSNSNDVIDEDDKLIFAFSESMDKSTITSSTVDARLTLSSGGSFGSDVAWNEAGTVCTVTLGSSETIDGGETVTPTSYVKDLAGNGCDTSISRAIPMPDVSATYIVSATYVDSDEKGIVDTDDTIIVAFNNAIKEDTLSSLAFIDFALFDANGAAFSWTGGTSTFIDSENKVIRIKIGQKVSNATTETLKSIGVLEHALKDKWGNYVLTTKRYITY